MRISTLLLGCLLLFNLTGWSLAGTLDQEYIPSSNNGLVIENSQRPAQTFEVGLNGIMDQIDVDVGLYGSLWDGITVEVRPTLPDGSPATNVLASVLIPLADVPASPQFINIDLSPYRIQVSSGDRLAIVLSPVSATDQFLWLGDGQGDYASGRVYIENGSGLVGSTIWDMGFRSYVNTTVVPEPSILMILFLSCGLLLVRRKLRAVI